MHSFEYILVMLLAVLASNLISQRLPRISTPLIQVALGVAIAMLPFFDFDMSIDTEFFLVLFIAPLLFEDAKKADKATLWRMKRPTLLLALGLVFITCLVVGAFMNWLIPALGLPAAFAFAAALAPTDAVAVGSLKDTADVKEEHRSLLQGEALFNDASSIVSFQFALAALAVGPYAAAAGLSELMFAGDIALTFLVMFIGGVAVGVGLMLLRLLLVKAIRRSGIESVTFHVLFELLTPFLVFLVAEAIHVSGIIAVVAAGIMYSFSGRFKTPENARLNVVSGSVWGVATFSLNGVVFLILGTQLPNLFIDVWESASVEHWQLIAIIILALLAILAIRFVWVFVMRRNALIATAEIATAETSMGAAIAADEDVEANAHKPAPDSPVGSIPALAASATFPPAASASFPVAASAASEVDPQTIEQRATARIDEMQDRRKEQRAGFGETSRQARLDAKKKIAAERKAPGFLNMHLLDALLLTLTGVKGAITLALLLTIPLTLPGGSAFPERSLLLFLASGIIVLSLLMANFLVPLIAPKKTDGVNADEERKVIAGIYLRVINGMTELVTDDNRAAIEIVQAHYLDRLQRLQKGNKSSESAEQTLYWRIIHWQRDHVLELIDAGQVSFTVGTAYLYRLGRTLARIEHHGEKLWLLRALFGQLSHYFRERRRYVRENPGAVRISKLTMRMALLELQLENTNFALKRLDELLREPDADEELIMRVATEFRRRVDLLSRTRRPADVISREQSDYLDYQVLDLEVKALQLERDAIEDCLQSGCITHDTARQLRDNVAVMEIDIEGQLE